jgi:hypothetical protein
MDCDRRRLVPAAANPIGLQSRPVIISPDVVTCARANQGTRAIGFRRTAGKFVAPSEVEAETNKPGSRPDEADRKPPSLRGRLG